MTSPNQGAGAVRRRRYCLHRERLRPAAAARRPALGAAGGAADAAAVAVVVRLGRGSCDLPVPGGRAARAAARSAGARAAESGALPPRPRGRVRVPRVCGSARVDHLRDRHRRRHADEDGSEPLQRLLHASSRSVRTDGRVSRRRSPAALAEHAPPALDQDRDAGAQDRQADPAARRREVHAPHRQLRRGRGDLDRQDVVRARRADRRVDLHAARPAAIRATTRSTVPAATGRAAAAVEHGVVARLVRARSGGAEPHHRNERRARLVDPLACRRAAARRAVRVAVRRVGRGYRDHPVPRPVARCDSTGALRAGRASAVGAVGRAAVPRDPPARRSRRRAERDGQRAAAPSAARDLRPRCGHGALRLPRRADRAAGARLGRAIWEFFADRITFEPWDRGTQVPTEVDLERTLSQ